MFKPADQDQPTEEPIDQAQNVKQQDYLKIGIESITV